MGVAEKENGGCGDEDHKANSVEMKTASSIEGKRRRSSEDYRLGEDGDNKGEKEGDEGDAMKERAKKEGELQKIVEEMNYLNKTKSQMIWLLKQVITAEKKLK